MEKNKRDETMKNGQLALPVLALGSATEDPISADH